MGPLSAVPSPPTTDTNTMMATAAPKARGSRTRSHSRTMGSSNRFSTKASATGNIISLAI